MGTVTDDGRKRAQAGFTLVELLVVMAILVLLASVVAPRVIGYLGSSRTKTAKIQIESLSTSVELYKLDTGVYPQARDGLSALVEQPAGVRGWNGPYLKGGRVPRDPWGQPYLYRQPGPRSEFQIFSYGADQKEGGDGEDSDIASGQI